MRLPRTPIIALAALLLAILCAPAAHASGRDVIRDCTDDEVLTKTYTQQEYKQALSQLASDADQYGNCRSVIKRAQLAALRDARAKRNGNSNGGAQNGATAPGGTGGTGGFGNAPAAEQLKSATPDERTAVDEGRGSAGKPVDLRGVAVAPGVSSAGDIPAPLLVLLALVLAGGLALAATRIRALVRSRRA
jgi:hypothetical protein